MFMIYKVMLDVSKQLMLSKWSSL